MFKKLIIMRGIPGSGKSTRAREIAKADITLKSCICSTDDFWLRPNGVYDINLKFIREAHAWNLDRAKKAMLDKDTNLIIIDNTNILVDHFKGYVDFAKSNEIEIECVSTYIKGLTNSEVEEIGKRSVHGVPLHVVKRMYNSYEETVLPMANGNWGRA